MAAATTNTIGYGVNASFDSNSLITRKRIINFAEWSAKKSSALEANDICQAIPVKAGEIVIGGYLKVITGNGASNVGSVGDGDSAAGYLAATTDFNTVATIPFGQAPLLQSASSTYGITGGKVYTADDTIDIKVLAGGTVGSVAVMELCVYIINTDK